MHREKVNADETHNVRSRLRIREGPHKTGTPSRAWFRDPPLLPSAERIRMVTVALAHSSTRHEEDQSGARTYGLATGKVGDEGRAGDEAGIEDMRRRTGRRTGLGKLYRNVAGEG